MAKLEEIPEVCRNEVAEWNRETKQLAEQLMGLLSEGLGLETDRLKKTTCLESRTMVGHYYPSCPQPDLTVGLTSHSDPGALTVLLQDQIGGLQIKHGDDWLDVKAVHGALIINIADVLQIMSNDEYKSVEHRVLANAFPEPRVSVAVFFNASPGAREELYGPFPELVSQEKPAVYRQFTYSDYIRRYFTKELDGKSLTNYYKLAFHEQPTEVKAGFYGRPELGSGVSLFSNIDLFLSKAASWRDTLQVKLGPKMAKLEEIPEVCRNEVAEWNRETKQLAEQLMGLLSEGLGLETGRLKKTTCLESRTMVGHYYPSCPQPDLTVGLTSHSDPGALTVLLQDQIGGLQIKHGDDWLDVKAVHGALIINIADVLQIMSNDEYKSVEHRVLANAFPEPRVSVAVFFNASPGAREELYGPFPELVSQEKPAVYRQFTYSDYIRRYFTKELDGKSLTNYYKL
ncbi:hypothetical protein SLEP1_g23657 [Rubroshorea leprosula]|uniref:Fe2OG dioxygenase domain-containing protein n=1 Tax=Rubroshorea leprosula TaxID=152421 RepID=A0AAV5JLV4_9ROSI|nr:hypothetical protein SLEP1_g23657 [Rubroshorea leprosula]